MTNLATVIAATIFTFSAVPMDTANAAPAPMSEAAVESVASPTDEGAQLAYLCEYVILWDAWGNAYFEYVCY